MEYNTNTTEKDFTVVYSPLGVQMACSNIFLGISFYLCIEVCVRLLHRCSRPSLYFWACLIGILAIAVCSIMVLIGSFRVTGAVLIAEHVSWWTFKTAQSMVLYSRLDLVTSKKRIVRYVLWTIIFTAVVSGIPTTVFTIIWNFPGKLHSKEWPLLPNLTVIFNQIQVAVLFAQETTISLLYIYSTVIYLKNRVSFGANRKATRRVLYYLIAVNTFIIAVDCTRLGLYYTVLEYATLMRSHTVAIYAIKLRIEFTVLNQLKLTLAKQDGRGTRRSNATTLPQIDTELGAEGHRSQESGIELVSRTGIEKKVVFTMTSHQDLTGPDGRSLEE